MPCMPRWSSKTPGSRQTAWPKRLNVLIYKFVFVFVVAFVWCCLTFSLLIDMDLDKVDEGQTAWPWRGSVKLYSYSCQYQLPHRAFHEPPWRMALTETDSKQTGFENQWYINEFLQILGGCQKYSGSHPHQLWLNMGRILTSVNSGWNDLMYQACSKNQRCLITPICVAVSSCSQKCIGKRIGWAGEETWYMSVSTFRDINCCKCIITETHWLLAPLQGPHYSHRSIFSTLCISSIATSIS